MLGHAAEQVFRNSELVSVQTSSKSGNNADYDFNVLTDDVSALIDKSNPDYIINCIGAIKPRIDEKFMYSVKDAIEINSIFPHELLEATANTQVKVIQIATDCVFSGLKGAYSETDSHDALDVYGKTKSLGEILSPNFLNIRASIIGPEKGRATSLLEWFLNQPKNSQIRGFANHYWNGVSTFHFAKVCLGVIASGNFESGKVHLVPQDKVNKFQLLNFFMGAYSRQDLQISEEYPDALVDRTLTTSNPLLNETLWKNAGYIEIPTIRQIVYEMKNFSESSL